MAYTDTNAFSLAYSIEPSLGTAGTTWFQLEPDDITAYGATITTVPRRPISKNRLPRKSVVVDLDSTVGFEHDLTFELVAAVGEQFFYAEAANYDMVFRAADVTVNGYTIPAATAAQAAKFQWVTAEGASLVFAQGYATSGNNGLRPLTADLAASGTELTVSAAGLTVETAPTNARVEVAGFRFGTSDVGITVSGGVATITTVDEDFTTMGLTVGQIVHVGGLTSSEQFSAGVGYGRITTIVALTLTLGSLVGTLATDPGTGETIDLLFGRFIRNVDVDADAEGTRYLTRSLHFEGAYTDLGGAGTDMYEYSAANLGNVLAWNLPMTDKATMTVGMIGTTSEDVTATRKSGAATAIAPLRTTAFSTATDIVSLTTDLLAAADTLFKSLTVTLGNNVSAEKGLGTLGGVRMNTGMFTVDIETEMLYGDDALTLAIRDNTTATLNLNMKNDDGAVILDIPALTFSGGPRTFEKDQAIKIGMTGMAHEDPTLGISASLSLIPTVP